MPTQPTAAVLSIGTELTRGEIVDTNAAWLGDQLVGLGLEVSAHDTVPDVPELISAALKRLGRTHKLVVVTGGLGPTTDDLTSETVAQLLGAPLERDAASLEAIAARMTRSGREMAPSNQKQADFPRGAEILPNAYGTAPGFAVTIGRSRAFFMPGVPSEMKPMFGTLVAPYAQSLVKERHLHQVRLRCYGLPESAVNDRLAGLEAEHGVSLHYRAHFPEIEVKVLADRACSQEAQSAARRGADEAKLRLDDAVWGEGDQSFAAHVGALIAAEGLKLGVAESCTGGLCAKLITDGSASAYFLGGCVTYSNDAKERLLGVPHQTLVEHGAVSAPVAIAMAQGVCDRMRAHISLSFTGIAGPTGGTPDKPVGLVHYAVATRDGLLGAEHQVFRGNRDRVRLQAVYAGLTMVKKMLDVLPPRSRP